MYVESYRRRTVVERGTTPTPSRTEFSATRRARCRTCYGPGLVKISGRTAACLSVAENLVVKAYHEIACALHVEPQSHRRASNSEQRGVTMGAPQHRTH